ncbi:MAG: xanthine dehydrogenase accessory protein XdhC [Spirochaetales bacterium]|nr:xanthine dehydrogenase accessory protein XdhC [Spirochaetales bacterium]
MKDFLTALHGHEGPAVEAIVVAIHGSVPVTAGARMLVDATGLVAGTVGGGKLEARVLQEAREMLQGRAAATRFFFWHLNRDIGMTCGGSVSVFLQLWHCGGPGVHIFGAGHVSQALVRVLAPLSFTVHVYDEREEWLARLPEGIQPHQTQDLAASVADIPDGSYILCMTRGHEADRPVLARALKENRFAFVGVIGSRAKRAVLERELQALEGVPGEKATEFTCPLGLPVGSDHPAEIAISIAAQLLQIRDRGSALRGELRSQSSAAP